jgi:Tfp pilus assembly protein PilO
VAEMQRKGKEILLVVASLAAASALSYFLVFAPKFREVQRLQTEVIASEADMRKALEVWGEMSHTSRSDIDRLERIVLSWRDKVPESPEAGTLLEEIGRQAVRHHLHALRLSVPEHSAAEQGETVTGPGGAADTEGTSKEQTPGEIRFRVVFFSSYRDMADFLDEIPRMKRLVSIRNLAIRGKDREMETTVELSAYHRSRQ